MENIIKELCSRAITSSKREYISHQFNLELVMSLLYFNLLNNQQIDMILDRLIQTEERPKYVVKLLEHKDDENLNNRKLFESLSKQYYVNKTKPSKRQLTNKLLKELSNINIIDGSELGYFVWKFIYDQTQYNELSVFVGLTSEIQDYLELKTIEPKKNKHYSNLIKMKKQQILNEISKYN